ncbi:membrane fusion protein (multidrug efflux system) [Rhodovulum imhoffii]|uniref:Membrane fusion protein (Multidrug efflux system) n=1 Tax=Rhodovulum imhoffii TaxID=365340 RepID=A0A2T5BNY3_9RHOB|nr:efflux RND transporter periplasmic adaptor subunit [Rhodovulum imhoffii]MBK5932552.1 efflux transporter periplasmic adaptor subunit [Rhodovulum imhoffii]PTN00693.1 membrane fusion protein (multidrug efflux system) [Rhodovulum imhoffii]
MRHARVAFSAAFAAVVLCLFYAVPVLAQEGRPPVTVTVQTIHSQDVTLTTTLPGRVVASGEAEVRPQVGGILTERLFFEGAFVEIGEPLYRIDPATYEAREAAARAAVAQAQARLSAATKEAERIQELLDRRVVSEQNVDDAIASRDAADAALQVAMAELLAAEIDLDRTTIKAPLSGWLGRSLATQGALVTAGQAEPLAVIRAIDPVYVDVTQSAAEIIRWRRGHTQDDLEGADLTVVLKLADGSLYEHTGHVLAAEPHVDEQTGVVVLRLEFPNPDNLLLPGMYVQVEAPQGVVRDVALVPQRAVSRDRRGQPTALVVNAENTVEQRTLTVLRDHGSDWIVSEGLSDGDRVIIAGLQKTAPGASVLTEEIATPDEQD